MNLSLCAQIYLFASSSAYSKATSWSTFLSITCEVALKSAKKDIKNLKLSTKG